MRRFQRTVLVDCAALGHYVKHSMRYLMNNGTNTGVMFGFLGLIKEAAERMTPGQFVFAWDSKKSHRKRLFPEYKSNRNPADKTPEERLEDELMRDQLEVLRTEIIPKMGFQNSFRCTGYEADDIIASCCLSLPGKKFIISRDNDLYQLLDSQTRMWDFQKKTFFTDGDFRDKWGIEPHEWKKVKMIAGCTGDGVPNVPGVKEPTAVKYIKGVLPPHYKAYKAIEKNKHILERNRPLVVLPFKGTPKFNVKKDKLSINGFWEICEKYGFNSYLEDIEEWVEILKMN